MTFCRRFDMCAPPRPRYFPNYISLLLQMHGDLSIDHDTTRDNQFSGNGSPPLLPHLCGQVTKAPEYGRASPQTHAN